MLKKLLKHELKATARIFLPLYALLLIFTAINRFFMVINSNRSGGSYYVDDSVFQTARWLDLMQGIAMMVFIAIIVGICVVTLVVTIQRFFRNLLGEEGYLMNTLPVTADQHIISKLLISCLWQIASFIMAILAIFLLCVDGNAIRAIGEFFTELGRMYQEYSYAIPITIEIVVLCFISLINGVLTFYAAAVVGSLVPKHPLLAGAGALIAFNTVESMVSGIIMSIVSRPLNNWYEQAYPYAYRSGIESGEAVASVMQIFLLIAIVLVAVFTVGYYIITRYMLSKKLNLE